MRGSGHLAGWRVQLSYERAEYELDSVSSLALWKAAAAPPASALASFGPGAQRIRTCLI